MNRLKRKRFLLITAAFAVVSVVVLGATHWSQRAGALIAMAAVLAGPTVIGSRGRAAPPAPFDIPEGGGWVPELPSNGVAIPRLDEVAPLEEPVRSRVIAWANAQRLTSVVLTRLHIQRAVRDPLHHARMLVSDLEALGGTTHSVERIRSIRRHIDQIARAIALTERGSLVVAPYGESAQEEDRL